MPHSLLSSSYAPRAPAPAPCHPPMDAHTDTPLSPLYSRDPAAAAAAAGNPSAGSAGVATAGAPPSVGLARSLFLPPRMITAPGVVFGR